MRKNQVLLLAGLCSVLLILNPMSASAQAGNMGTVIGTVTDNKDRPIAKARVVIKSLDSDTECVVETNDKGGYGCPDLPAGQYEIAVIYKGATGKREVQLRGGIFGTPANPAFRNRFDFRLTTSEEEKEAARKAREEFQKVKVRFDRAVVLNREGQHQEALTELEAVVEKAPSQWVIHNQLAVAYAGLGRLEEATASYQKAIEINPTQAGLHNNLGQLYVKMNRIDDGLKEFEAAAELDPTQAGVYYFNIGAILYNKGEMAAAVEPFRKATELDPTRAAAFYLLGVCLYNTAEIEIEGGEVKTALKPGTRESFEQYLALAPEGKYANDAKAMLQAIDATVPAAVRVRKRKK